MKADTKYIAEKIQEAQFFGSESESSASESSQREVESIEKRLEDTPKIILNKNRKSKIELEKTQPRRSN